MEELFGKRKVSQRVNDSNYRHDAVFPNKLPQPSVLMSFTSVFQLFTIYESVFAHTIDSINSTYITGEKSQNTISTAAAAAEENVSEESHVAAMPIANTLT